MTELVLVLSDSFIPLKSPDIDPQFKSIIMPNKVQYVLCLGNVINQETFDWLNGLSSNLIIVRGDYDINKNYPEKKSIKIGNFQIGMIHGHQIMPLGDLDSLSNIQRELDCDILLYGHTHKLNIVTKDNKLFLNPGSITGALSPLMEDCFPSFMILALQDNEVIIYSYVLSDRSKKFEVGHVEYIKGSNELKVIQKVSIENIEEENEEKEEDEKINNEEKNDVEKKEEEKTNNEKENNTQEENIQDNNDKKVIENEKEDTEEKKNKDE